MTTIAPIETAKPAAQSGRPRVGVLLVNLGTPDTADAHGVRVYLKEFLSDARVIEDQGLIWQLVLNGIILRTRPRTKARDYLKIWNNEKNESPLKTITRVAGDKLAAAIAGPRPCRGGLGDALRQSLDQVGHRCADREGCDRILAVPLYPQYSAATSATVCDEVFRVLARLRAQPTLRVTPPYYDDEAYIEALAHLDRDASGDAAVQAGADRRLLPRHAENLCRQGRSLSEPMRRHHRGAAHAGSGWTTTKLLLTFQSRFGNDEWLQPYTDKTMERLAKEGVRRIAVVTPGFSADCLETLEEIAQENAEIFKHNGGEQFSAIPCLNDSDPGMDVIRTAGAARASGLDLTGRTPHEPPRDSGASWDDRGAAGLSAGAAAERDAAARRALGHGGG